MTFTNPHAKIDAGNRERDRRTAAALRADPALAQVARDNLRRWLNAERGRPHPALLEWQAVLDFLTVGELAAFLESRTPKAERLRQSSPFVAVTAVDESAVLVP